jgi:hypothetical protein
MRTAAHGRSEKEIAPDVFGGASTEAIHTRRHLLTMGVNYRFGG